MPAYLLHQNMREFYPTGKPPRVNAYLGLPVAPPLPANWPPMLAPGARGLTAIHTNVGPPQPLTPAIPELREQICIAAFSEVRGADQPVMIPYAQAAIGGGTGAHVHVFRTGRTAFDYEEWLAIAIAKPVHTLMLGRVVFDAGGEPHVESITPPFDPGWLLRSPADYGADYRWVVYVVVQLHKPGQQVAIGFTHNTYKLDTRFSVAQRIPAVIAKIKAHPAVRVDQVIVGGDFNTTPHEVNERHPAYDYSRAVKDKLGNFPGGQPGGTTWHGQLFDYWLTDIPPTNVNPLIPGGEPVPKASIDLSNWDGLDSLMSDHVATLLRIV